MSTPTRKTSEVDLDKWNTAMRATPMYQAFLQSIGQAGKPVKLSRSQQSDLEGRLAAAGTPIPKGMHIDQGGNLNQKNRLGRNVAIGAAVTGATLATMGAAGVGPMSGLFGTAAPEAAGAGGWLAPTTLPAATSYGTGSTLSALPSIAGAAGVPALETAGAVAPQVAAAAAPSAMRWIAPVGASALSEVMANRRAGQQNAVTRAGQQLDESKLDPFRGQVMQGRDAAQLDWMANQGAPPPALQLDPKYGAGMTLPAPRSYGPSPDTRALLRAGSEDIAAGNTAPSVTGGQPLSVVRLAAARRKRTAQPVDDTSWLA